MYRSVTDVSYIKNTPRSRVVQHSRWKVLRKSIRTTRVYICVRVVVWSYGIRKVHFRNSLKRPDRIAKTCAFRDGNSS